MSRLDRSRLATYFGSLIALGLGFEALSTIANVGMVRLAPLYMFTPLVAGMVTVWRFDLSLSGIGLRWGSGRWFAIAAVAPIALAFATLGLSLSVPGVTLRAAGSLVPGISLPQGIVGILAALAVVVALGVTVNAFMALGEEVGWRGYLLWELAPLGFWRASVLIGAVWGLWHAPVILEGYNYPSFPVLGVAAMTLATISFSVVYTYLVVRARSVLAAVFFHGVFNASGGLVFAFAATNSPELRQLVASPVGLAAVAVFALVAVLIALDGAPALDRGFADRREFGEPDRGDP
ncbi:MAG: lysostaphin resistance A-like protein [Halanaeroarchaeum sp.]